MKRVLSFALALVLAVGICFTAPVTFDASAASMNDLVFTLNDDGTSYSVSAKDRNISGNVTIPSTYNGLPVTVVSDFYECYNITSVTIPDSVTEIRGWAFADCTSLSTINVGDNVRKIGYGAFDNTAYYNGANWYHSDGEYGYALYVGDVDDACKYLIKCSSDIPYSHLEIYTGTLAIADYAFEECTELEGVTIPDSVRSIGDMAFLGCVSLEDISIGQNVEWIGFRPFDGTAYYNGSHWYADEHERIYCLYIDGYLVDCDTYDAEVSYSIREGTRCVADGTFSYDEYLTSITIPASVVSLGNEPFYGCVALSNITVASNNPNYSSSNGVLFNKSKTELIKYPAKKTNTSYSIPQSVKVIGGGAFCENGYLASVSVPSSVQRIKYSAFEGCTALSSFEIPDGITEIEDYVFTDCSSLASIKIPNTVTSISYGGFLGCASLKSVDIPKNLVSGLSGYKFARCSSLESINVASGNSAYTSIDGVLFNKSNTEILKYPAAKSGTAYTIPYGVEMISHAAFEGSKNLTNVGIPSTVEEIDDGAFYNCKEMKSVTIPESVTGIGYEAFGYYDSPDYETYKISGFTINGTAGSAAEAYADENAFIFNEINNNSSELVTPVTQFVATKDGINVTWTAVDGALGYKIYRRQHVNGSWTPWTCLGNVGSYAVSYLDTSAASGCAYGYAVSAFNDAVETPYSNEDVLLYIAAPKIATPKSTTKGISVSWSAVAGATGYVICRKTGNGLVELARVAPETRTFVDTNVSDGQTVTYAVAALDFYGNPCLYDEISTTYVKPLTLATPTVKVANTAKGIKVTWNSIANADSYVVYRRFYSTKNKRWSGWTALKTNCTSTAFVDTTVKIGINYRYTVKAVSGKTASSFKSTSTIKYDVIPTVKVANASNGIKVSWSTVANATGYTVYSSTYNAKTKKWSGWTNRGTAGKNTTSWVDKKAKNGVYYKYTVRAVCGNLKSSFKASANIIRLGQPTVKVAKASNGVKVTWTKTAGAKKYAIYRSRYLNGAWTSWTLMGNASNKTTSWVDKKAVSGIKYKYTVRAVNGNNKSSFKASSAINGFVNAEKLLQKHVKANATSVNKSKGIYYLEDYIITDTSRLDYTIAYYSKTGETKFMYNSLSYEDYTDDFALIDYKYKANTQRFSILYDMDESDEIAVFGDIETKRFSGSNKVLSNAQTNAPYYPSLWVDVGAASAYLLLISADNILKETKAGIDMADLGFVSLYN